MAESLGISSTLLYDWIRAAEEEGSDAVRGRGNRTEVGEELWQLRRKNRELEQELEFLKK